MPKTSSPKIEVHREIPSEFKKPRGCEQRSREYLTEDEIKQLLAAARSSSRHSHRNYCIVLTSYRHGLRVGEAARLKWSDVDFGGSKIHIRRLKAGNSSSHYMYGAEVRALKKLQKESKEGIYVFESERGGHITGSGIRQMVTVLGNAAGLGNLVIHPHMFRHSCGYYLINKSVDVRLVQDWLGHRDIAMTVLYTKLAPNRFKEIEAIFDE